MMRIGRRVLLAWLAAVAAAGPFPRVPSAPAVGRIEPPPPARPTPRYVNIFNRVGRSYEVVPLDEDGRLPERFRQSPICSTVGALLATLEQGNPPRTHVGWRDGESWNRWFVDSPLEGSGFEPSVPRDTTKVSRGRHIGGLGLGSRAGGTASAQTEGSDAAQRNTVFSSRTRSRRVIARPHPHPYS